MLLLAGHYLFQGGFVVFCEFATHVDGDRVDRTGEGERRFVDVGKHGGEGVVSSGESFEPIYRGSCVRNLGRANEVPIDV